MNNLEDRGRDWGLIMSKVFMLLGFGCMIIAPRNEECAFPIIPWQYGMWFFLIAHVWDRRRHRGIEGIRLNELVIGPWCMYPILFFSAVLGVIFLSGVMRKSPYCIDPLSKSLSIILIMVGFTLTIFFWGSVIYYILM